MEHIDTLVIGAGVVGLACARTMAQQGHEVVIVEASADLGYGNSSRNSEVIHAGMYYPHQSLKALLCVEGKHDLYAYASQRGIAHRRCGKLIVATEERQLSTLDGILRKAQLNGVDDVVAISARDAQRYEPELVCVAALESPSTGIIDSHGLMLALLGDAEDHGAMLARCSVVRGLERDEAAKAWRVRVEVIDEGTLAKARNAVLCLPGLVGEAHDFRVDRVINAAGLGANRIAAMVPGMPEDCRPSLHLAKGTYFQLSGRCPFSRLIYPMPNESGLGVHLTLDMAGQGRFGPDVEWVQEESYAVDVSRCTGFYQEIRSYWPGLPDGALNPGYAGIRPKLQAPGALAQDFRIDGPGQHGFEGLVNLLGIESPGLTASLAIARCVATLLADAED
jgi:L-2-hydroxyglutarate oxidase LhgO